MESNTKLVVTTNRNRGSAKMNDRFKFRAFDTFAEKMIQNHISICEGELYEWCPDGLHIKHDIGDSAIVMQSTGLKDKNGKLIYEGDVLQSEEYPFKNEKGYNYAAEVLWDDASATFYYYTFRISNNVVGRSTGNTGELNEYEDWKVIGNIYENPELLKECE